MINELLHNKAMRINVIFLAEIFLPSISTFHHFFLIFGSYIPSPEAHNVHSNPQINLLHAKDFVNYSKFM